MMFYLVGMDMRGFPFQILFAIFQYLERFTLTKHRKIYLGPFFEIFGNVSYLVGQFKKLNEMGGVYKQCEELTDFHVTTLIKSADRLGLINY